MSAAASASAGGTRRHSGSHSGNAHAVAFPEVPGTGAAHRGGGRRVENAPGHPSWPSPLRHPPSNPSRARRSFRPVPPSPQSATPRPRPLRRPWQMSQPPPPSRDHRNVGGCRCRSGGASPPTLPHPAPVLPPAQRPREAFPNRPCGLFHLTPSARPPDPHWTPHLTSQRCYRRRP